MVYRLIALCLALAASPALAQEVPFLPAEQPPTDAAPLDLIESQAALKAMEAKEIERLLAGPKNNAAAIEAIESAEAPGSAITDGAKSLAKSAAKTAVTPAVTAAGSAAVSGVVGVVAAPALIVGGIAVVGAGLACAQFCDND